MNMHPERARGFERVDDVEVMCPGFGEILPGMSRRIGADEARLPTWQRTFIIVSLERLAIILAFIAEDFSEFAQPSSVTYQAVPEIMADLVTEMAEKGAVAFTHFLAPLFALGAIRFRERQRDQPIVVSGNDMVRRR